MLSCAEAEKPLFTRGQKMSRTTKKVGRFVHHKKVLDSQLSGLQTLASILNASEPHADQHNEIRSIIKEIVEMGMDPDTLSKACERFNGYAERYPVLFDVILGKDGPIPLVNLTMVDIPQGGVWLLWQNYFHDCGHLRLKQCPVCLKWFVDTTRNKSMIRCSSGCTGKWWTRDRRRKKGHKKGGKRHEKRT